MNVGQLFADAWDGLRRNMSMAVSVVLVTMISVVLLGMGMLAQRQADLMRGYWYDKVQVSIYLCTDTSTSPNCASGGVTEAQKKTIESQLDQLRPLVEEVYYESEQEAYDRFMEDYANSEVAEEEIEVGDIPPSYRVQLSDPEQHEKLQYINLLRQEGVAEEKLAADDWAYLRRMIGNLGGARLDEATAAFLARVAALGGNGGLIALARDGRFAMPFTGSGMKRAVAGEGIATEVAIG